MRLSRPCGNLCLYGLELAEELQWSVGVEAAIETHPLPARFVPVLAPVRPLWKPGWSVVLWKRHGLTQRAHPYVLWLLGIGQK